MGAARLYNRDIDAIRGFMEKKYKGTSPDLVVVDGKIGYEQSLSKRIFGCKSYAYRWNAKR